ncbi:MAG: hypothetical protein ACOYT7_03190 [Patescibacteria group bacterium]
MPPEKWHSEAVSVVDLPLSLQAGVNTTARQEVITELISRVSDKFNLRLESPDLVKEKPAEKTGQSLHDQIKDKLAEIGQMEKLMSEKEYPIDGERLDVTWRKVVRGVPSKAFEVQIGGNPHQALAKLKHAFDLWNSEPFIIVDKGSMPKVQELLSGTFHELTPHIHVVSTDKVQDLYESLTREAGLKKDFGLE